MAHVVEDGQDGRIDILGDPKSVRHRQHRAGVQQNEFVLFLQPLQNAADLLVVGQRFGGAGIPVPGGNER